ncbi:MAG: PulJ/GspJ family protein, partial [Aureliella sp.]
MRKRNRSSRHRSARGGFTLLEVLIATAVTLLMMVSLAQVFKIIGDSMKQGRAALQMNNTLRSVSFRLRHDLNNLTVRVDPPADASAGSGYFEYFDGSMTDYTCTLFDPTNGSNPALTTDAVRSSRFGDLDDVLMFTARAGDSWYVGQVPAFLLNTSLIGTTSDSDNDSTLDKYEPVMISSQLAEIVVFARPVSTDPTDYPYFDDVDGNNLPDAYQLHYRALLIRPDLNVNGVLPDDKWLGTGGIDYLDMAGSFQKCDLSMHRVADGISPAADSVAANSLDDLTNPANRFAHYQYQIPGSSNSTTMPLLALEPIPQSAFPIFSEDPNPVRPANLATLAGSAGNFLNPSFVLAGNRRGEDVLANDLLAFDVKGFDSGVPVIGINGPDGVAGASGSGVLGQDGSDDLILTPNDPGYVAALASGSGTTVAYGGYVDLMWGRKSLAALKYFGTTSVTGTPNLSTELSGLTTSSSGFTYAPGLIRSGKVLFDPSASILSPPLLLQPTFDTWTTRYEDDGAVQAELDGSIRGVINFD